MNTISRFFLKYSWTALVLLSGAGTSLQLAFTRAGIGATGDSVWYLQGAENLLRGIGYGILRGDGFITNKMFPPLYSVLLAGLGLSHIPIFDIARYLNAVLFGANIFLTGWLAYKITASPFLSIISSSLVLLFYDLLIIHAWAMSEPLFIFLTLLSILFLFRTQEENRYPYLLVGVLLVGLSVITRYLGIALLVTIVLWRFVVGQKRIKWRILESFLLLIIGTLPLVLFYFTGPDQTNSAGRTEILLRQFPKQNLAQIELAFLSWFGIPNTIRYTYKHLVTSLLFLPTILPFVWELSSIHRPATIDSRRMLRYQFLTAVYTCFYIGIMVLTVVFSLVGDPNDWRLNAVPRFLLPVFPTFVLFLAITIKQYSSRFSINRFTKVIPFVIALVILASMSVNFGVRMARPMYMGYTNIKNELPELVSELERYAASRPIIANNYELAYFLIDEPVYSIPGRGDELTGIINPEYPVIMSNLWRLIEQGAVVIIYTPSEEAITPVKQLIDRLQVIGTYDQITLYSLSGQ